MLIEDRFELKGKTGRRHRTCPVLWKMVSRCEVVSWSAVATCFDSSLDVNGCLTERIARETKWALKYEPKGWQKIPEALLSSGAVDAFHCVQTLNRDS